MIQREPNVSNTTLLLPLPSPPYFFPSSLPSSHICLHSLADYNVLPGHTRKGPEPRFTPILLQEPSLPKTIVVLLGVLNILHRRYTIPVFPSR